MGNAFGDNKNMFSRKWKALRENSGGVAHAVRAV
jgi:hypothetical protein